CRQRGATPPHRTPASARIDEEHFVVIQQAIVRGSLRDGLQFRQGKGELFAVGLTPHVGSDVLVVEQCLYSEAPASAARFRRLSWERRFPHFALTFYAI